MQYVGGAGATIWFGCARRQFACQAKSLFNAMNTINLVFCFSTAGLCEKMREWAFDLGIVVL
jgi:hypothetical protein